MRPYQRGAQGEYYIMNILKSKGYKVLRSSGSHTPIDIIASRDGFILAIQSKKEEVKVLSVYDKEKLVEWAYAFRATPVLASKREGRWIFTYVETGFRVIP